VVTEEMAEAHRRETRFRGGRSVASLAGRTVIVVDDGLATGATMRAVVRSLRKQHPARLVVAVPVGSREACAAFGQEADQVVCLDQPVPFLAVGAFYDHFEPIEDAEVERILEQWQAARRKPAAPAA
jgi:putative phosphoribosyl transferase